MVLDFLAVNNFDFARKIGKKNWGENLVKMLGVLDFLAVDNFDFTRKIVKKNWGFDKIDFLDKNLTFRIV